MCGICGIAPLTHTSSGPEERRHRVASMLDALKHRGPQGSSQGESQGAIFGAQRLAIRGLSGGLQPMADPRTGVLAVCNGEIDNHVELRQWLAAKGHAVSDPSDVAVVLPLYLKLGAKFVERLDGPFVIAIWDPRNRTTVLARDKCGERSLFYSVARGDLAFANELAGLAVANGPTEPDPVAVTHFLEDGYVVAPLTGLKDVFKVPPGHIVVVDAGGRTRAERYWRWPIVDAAKRPPAERDFDALLRAAVARQTATDVPFGIFLSGGLDSSLIAAVAIRQKGTQPPVAYAARIDADSYDEGANAIDIGKRLGMRVEEVWVRSADFPGVVRSLIHSSGELLADPAWIPAAMLSRQAAQTFRYVLGGEGADELFGGYPTYLGARFADTYSRLPAPLRQGIRRVIEAWPPSDKKVPISFLLKKAVAADGLRGLARHRQWTASVAPDLLATLGRLPSRRSEDDRGDLLDIVQRHDLETMLGDGLLSKADRGGMHAGVEVRAPYLDPAIVEFAATIPAHERVGGLSTKRFLKRVAESYLPREIVHRRKRGLSLPMTSWLRGPLREWALARLRSGRLDRIGVRSEPFAEALTAHTSRPDAGRSVWTVLVLEHWLEWQQGLAKRP